MALGILTWFLAIFTLFFMKRLLFSSRSATNLPPGPPALLLIIHFLCHPESFSQIGPFLSKLCRRYGPLFSLPMGLKPIVVIANSSLIHQAMVKNGAIFAGRPKEFLNQLFGDSNNERVAISRSEYGDMWRSLRRNLASFLHPIRVKSHASIRKRVMDGLVHRLREDSKRGQGIHVYGYLHHSIHSMISLVCFGDNLHDDHIREINAIGGRIRSSVPKLKIFSIFPKLGSILYKHRLKEFRDILKDQDRVFVPLIRSRSELKQDELSCVSYTDTLLDLNLPEEKIKLSEGDIVSLCSEFMMAGADSTAAALQWVMANLVKYPKVQTKVFEDMKRVVGEGEDEIKEDDIQKMVYLKAVILETLRRNPTVYLSSIPHAVVEDAELGGYFIPKNTMVNFLIADIGRDPNLWEDPEEFKPERFLNVETSELKDLDIKGGKEIKMIPFGTGRRMCPGFNLAMANLEYFAAYLIWHFEWSAEDGQDIDLTEMHDELTFLTLKNPLTVQLSPRF